MTAPSPTGTGPASPDRIAAALAAQLAQHGLTQVPFIPAGRAGEGLFVSFGRHSTQGRRQIGNGEPGPQSWAMNMVTPPVAKFGTSAPAAWPSGVAMAASNASWEAKPSSAIRK
jgi:hypothetical protein